MKISDSRLDELIALYRAEYGVDLDRKEAERLGTTIVRLVEAVYAPEGWKGKLVSGRQISGTI